MRTSSVATRTLVLGILLVVCSIDAVGDANECAVVPNTHCRGDRVERPANADTVVLVGHASVALSRLKLEADRIELHYAPNQAGGQRRVLVMAEGAVVLRLAAEAARFRDLTFSMDLAQ